MISTTLVNLGGVIRRLREEQGASISRLSAAANIEQDQLQALEAGQLDPRYGLLLDLADALDTTPDAIARRWKALEDQPTDTTPAAA